jgi:hypothetical protein
MYAAAACISTCWRFTAEAATTAATLASDERQEDRIRDVDADTGGHPAEARDALDVDDVAARLLDRTVVAILAHADAHAWHCREPRLSQARVRCFHAREIDRDVDVALVGKPHGSRQVDLENVAGLLRDERHGGRDGEHPEHDARSLHGAPHAKAPRCAARRRRPIPAAAL